MFYDNETGLHELEGWELDCAAWFEDTDRLLYVVPYADYRESIGPDNATMDELNRMMREDGHLDGRAIRRLGLTPVAGVLRRFSPEDGLYHA